MALQGFGEVWGLYDRFVRFDDLVHFSLPMLTAPVVYIALARLDVVPDPGTRRTCGTTWASPW
ncbi:hypothetical protein [Blastococcus sp. SYSU DS0539]